MSHRHTPTRILAALIALAAASRHAESGSGGPSVPFTVLFDTRTPSDGPLAPEALANRSGWTRIPEDNTTHKFLGDAVFLNNHIAVVLRRRGSVAAVYAWADTGPKQRVLLVPLAAGGRPASAPASVRILENSAGAVMLEAACKTDKGSPLSARYRLTTGEMALDVRPGPGVRTLRVGGRIRYVVVPDYFADDMVYRAAALPAPVVGLPTENFFLGLIEGGDALVMCVWKSKRRNARVVRLPGPQQRAACEMDCQKGKSTWVAVLEHPGIWHARDVKKVEMGRDIALDWRPGYPARWRMSFAHAGGVSRSHPFQANGTVGSEGCWLENGRAFVRLLSRGNSDAIHPEKFLVVYPIERSRETPLSVFCPTDVMRNTLGVGPCQYLLDLEGLAADGGRTPAQVTAWVEGLLQHKRAGRHEEQIRERLRQMMAHFRESHKRIAEYVGFAVKVRSQCDKALEDDPKRVGLARDILEAMSGSPRHPPLHRAPLRAAEDAAARMAALIGRDDALPQCRELGATLRTMERSQDAALARFRMIVRRVRQLCLTAEATSPKDTELARRIRAQCEQRLWEKSNAEPRKEPTP